MIRFEVTAIDTIPQIAWTATRAGRIDALNRKWYQYTGLRQPKTATADSFERQWLDAIHPDDRRLCREALHEAIKRGQPVSIEMRLRGADGVTRWFHTCVGPIDDAPGGADGWLGICTNIDEYKRQGERFAFIAKAGEVLAASLDLQTTLQGLLGIIVPEFGDWAAIDLFDDDDRLQTAAVIHADRRKMSLMTRLLGQYNHDSRWEPRIAAALRRNQPLLVREVSDELIARAAAPDLLDVIRRLAPHSAVTIPLRTRGRTIGSLVSYWAETPRHYDESDLPLFEELTKRAAVSIENARLYEREREIAAEFQRAALPVSLPQIAGIHFDGIYVPSSDRELLGGDWYDALRLADGRIVVSIGDVAGSGLAAAVIMSSMRQVLRGVAQVYADPIAMLDAADRTLKTEHPECFVTAFVGVFDPVVRTLTYASAGHPPPLLRDEKSTVTPLATSGLPLGLRVRGETAASVVVPEKAFLVLYTDGLIESQHDIIEGQERLQKALVELDVFSILSPAEAIYRGISHNGRTDDIVILTMRFDADEKRTKDETFNTTACRWAFDTADADAGHNARYAFVGAVRECGLQAEALDAAELVFGELLGNVVRYAAGPIEIIFDRSESTLVLHFLDRGPGFTLMPRLPSDLLSERGRGLYIVWALADDFNVTERHDGGSHARAVINKKVS